MRTYIQVGSTPRVFSRTTTSTPEKRQKCLGAYNEFSGDYDCGYASSLDCDECKYGFGRKDPEAECNHQE